MPAIAVTRRRGHPGVDERQMRAWRPADDHFPWLALTSANVPRATVEAAQTRHESQGPTGWSGGGGIRTHGPLARTPVFKTGAIDHSATLPWSDLEYAPDLGG